MVGTSVQEGPRLRERGNEVFGAQHPANTPTRKTPVLLRHHCQDVPIAAKQLADLREAIDDNDRVLVDIVDIASRRDRLPQVFFIIRVDVPRIELYIAL